MLWAQTRANGTILSPKLMTNQGLKIKALLTENTNIRVYGLSMGAQFQSNLFCYRRTHDLWESASRPQERKAVVRRICQHLDEKIVVLQ